MGGGGHLGPGGVGIDLHGDAAVLVGAVLDDPLVVLGVPHLLGELASPLGELEVHEDVGVGEVFASLGVHTGEEAGREDFPGATRLPVGHPDDGVTGVANFLKFNSFAQPNFLTENLAQKNRPKMP